MEWRFKGFVLFEMDDELLENLKKHLENSFQIRYEAKFSLKKTKKGILLKLKGVWTRSGDGLDDLLLYIERRGNALNGHFDLNSDCWKDEEIVLVDSLFHHKKRDFTWRIKSKYPVLTLYDKEE